MGNSFGGRLKGKRLPAFEVEEEEEEGPFGEKEKGPTADDEGDGGSRILLPG